MPSSPHSIILPFLAKTVSTFDSFLNTNLPVSSRVLSSLSEKCQSGWFTLPNEIIVTYMVSENTCRLHLRLNQDLAVLIALQCLYIFSL